MSASLATTPLARQLGLARGVRVWFRKMPAPVRAAIDPDATGLEEIAAASDGLQAAVVFVTHLETLKRELNGLRPLVGSSSFIWLCWPTEEGEVDEAAVRAMADACGLVATQSCEIEGGWSGLRLIIGNRAD